MKFRKFLRSLINVKIGLELFCFVISFGLISPSQSFASKQSHQKFFTDRHKWVCCPRFDPKYYRLIFYQNRIRSLVWCCPLVLLPKLRKGRSEVTFRNILSVFSVSFETREERICQKQAGLSLAQLTQWPQSVLSPGIFIFQKVLIIK